MYKIFQLILCLVMSAQVSAQSKFIIYDLPEEVTQKAEEYIKKCISGNVTKNFIAEITKDRECRYVLFIMSGFNTKNQSGILVDEEIVKKTNRMLRVTDSILLPLIFGEDFDFAFLGETPPRKPGGSKGRKRVIFNNDSYSIIFDRTGKIYKN